MLDLEAAIHFKRVRNSSLVEEFGVDILGHKLFTEAMDPELWMVGSIPVALKVRDNPCWSSWKSKCRYK